MKDAPPPPPPPPPPPMLVRPGVTMRDQPPPPPPPPPPKVKDEVARSKGEAAATKAMAKAAGKPSPASSFKDFDEKVKVKEGLEKALKSTGKVEKKPAKPIPVPKGGGN